MIIPKPGRNIFSVSSLMCDKLNARKSIANYFKGNSEDEQEDTRYTYLDNFIPTGRDDDRVGNVGTKADARNPKKLLLTYQLYRRMFSGAYHSE